MAHTHTPLHQAVDLQRRRQRQGCAHRSQRQVVQRAPVGIVADDGWRVKAVADEHAP